VIETANTEIDVDALMAEIRVEVMRARAAGGALPVAAGPAPGEGWYGVLDQLRVAEQHAAVGLEVPPFGRYGGLKRRLARAAARIVLFLTQVTAQPQRTYNVSSLAALKLLAERVQALEAELAALRAQRAPRAPAGARPERDPTP
jgi:hypothetical protein